MCGRERVNVLLTFVDVPLKSLRPGATEAVDELHGVCEHYQSLLAQTSHYRILER
jgi:hypothetical protein